MRATTVNRITKAKKTTAKRALPHAFVRAAGLLKGKLKLTPVQYQRALRREW